MFLFPSNPPVVCIDPGHPSEVGRGTTGRTITELHAAWEVAQILRADLRSKGVMVVLTKSFEEQFVTNRRRAEIANNAKALLMVRLHCDASLGTGFTTYYPDRQGSIGGFKGPPPQVLVATRIAAHEFHRVLALKLSPILVDRGLKGDELTAIGSKQGALTGSIYSQVPTVLVEMVVLTNRRDEVLIATVSGRKKIAGALAWATLAAIRAEKGAQTPMHRSNPKAR